MAEFRKTRYLDLISDDIGDVNFGNVTIRIEDFEERLNKQDETNNTTIKINNFENNEISKNEICKKIKKDI